MERKKNRRRAANRVKSSGVDYGARGSIYFHGGSKKVYHGKVKFLEVARTPSLSFLYRHLVFV